MQGGIPVPSPLAAVFSRTVCFFVVVSGLVDVNGAIFAFFLKAFPDLLTFCFGLEASFLSKAPVAFIFGFFGKV